MICFDLEFYPMSYHHEFLRLFGFDLAGVDYEADVETLLNW